MNSKPQFIPPRTIDLKAATGIGVGAMIGGGILILAGVAFSVGGPSAILAFLLNGAIAIITALSFAEMASASPQNGGTYTFAKKALTVQIAFGVGWVVWFASLAAAAFYALGFAAFVVFALQQIPFIGFEHLLQHRITLAFLALLAVLGYGFKLSRSTSSGGNLANVAKLLVFAILIAGGFAALFRTPFSEITHSFDTFFTGGFSGVIAAMGYSFVAFQGFVLIAFAAGEIKNPETTILKSMLTTIAIALGIYIPLLLVVMTVGIPTGETLTNMSSTYPETLVVVTAQNYLGSFGFWLVLLAGIFSMLTALQANLFAASRIAFSMAKDRTLTRRLAKVDRRYGTPSTAIFATTGVVVLMILLLPDVASAAAASSLIFLLSFVLAHGITILMRERSDPADSVGSSAKKPTSYRMPYYPAIPIIGIVASLGLATFQSIMEPTAGVIALLCLFVGGVLFVSFFVREALVADASEEARDPDMAKLRGHSPLVLLPISNPANAGSKIFLAKALAPPKVGRVLLLSIVSPSSDREKLNLRLSNNREVVHSALGTSFDTGLRPDTLITIAQRPMPEIERVARLHRCESLLLGLSDFSNKKTKASLESLIKNVRCDVVVFRQPIEGWNITKAKSVLIPVAGFGSHDVLRARIAASLWRASRPEVTFLQVLPASTSKEQHRRNRHRLEQFAASIIPGTTRTRVVLSDDPQSELVRITGEHDVVIMGLRKSVGDEPVFGEIHLRMAKDTDTALIFISKK